MELSTFLIGVDRCCDYIPLISTVTNLVDLFQKCIYSSRSSSGQLNKRYYKHIKDKKWTRCLLLVLPFVGNAIVAICAALKKKRSSSEDDQSIFEDPLHSLDPQRGRLPKEVCETATTEALCISLDQVKTIDIDLGCPQSYPCFHEAKVTLSDGKISCGELTGSEVWSILNSISSEKINNNRAVDTERLKQHFQKYHKSSDEALSVLNNFLNRNASPQKKSPNSWAAISVTF